MVWKKVLYEKQAYPDNYVEPEQFLDGLRKNLYTKTYSLSELILSSTVVSVQFTCVCLFVGLYWFIQEGWLHPLTLFTTSTTLTILGFIFTTVTSMHWHTSTISGLIADSLPPALLFILFLSGVSPILRTLTESISTDTIWAMTVGMMLVHLLFHNYGNQSELVTSAISLNAAIFGSVCLASRLSSTLGAFVVMVFSVQTFALLPVFRAKCKVLSCYSVPCILVSLMGISLLVLVNISTAVAVCFLLAILMVNLLCPLWLHQLQQLKNTIHGPWDEAVPHP